MRFRRRTALLLLAAWLLVLVARCGGQAEPDRL